ncbi:ankyrin [Wilcoxina mikolae CBS 423.85]|nr:ankyrin [Wilcoxina mikolae CBS 423.85]
MLLEKAAPVGSFSRAFGFSRHWFGPNNIGVLLDARHHAGKTLLSLAATFGRGEIVEMLLAKGADPRIQDSTGKTPFHLAAEAGHSGVAEMLLTAGVNPRSTDRALRTPLHLATAAGHLDIIEMLVSRKDGSLEIVDDDGNTPLSISLESGNIQCIQVLLAAGANPRPMDIHLAAARGHSDVVTLLASRHGECLEIIDGKGNTPLSFAVKYRNLQCIQVLLAAGVKPRPTDIAARGHSDIIELLFSSSRQSEFLEIIDGSGNTPLYYALKNGHLQCVKVLLAAGAIPRLADIHIAAVANHSDVLEMVVSREPECLEIVDDDMNTSLLFAVKHGNILWLQKLLAKGKNPYNINRSLEGRHDSLLSVAVRNGDFAITELLLAAGADPNDVDYTQHTTPLMNAIALQDIELIVELLLANGANPNRAGYYNRTPLSMAAIDGNPQIVELLLRAKASPNIVDSGGRTALTHAIELGDNPNHIQVIELLLGVNAYPSTTELETSSPKD